MTTPAPDPAGVRRLFTRFIALVLIPTIGLVGFGVMAITNERAAVEKRFQEEYGGRLRTLAGQLARTLDDEASRLAGTDDTVRSESVDFRFTLGPDGLQPTRPLPPETASAIEAAVRANAPLPGVITLVPIPRGPARGLYAIRRDDTRIEGIAFSETQLASVVEREGHRRFPADAARFTLEGPREPATPSGNPMRRLLEEITQERPEANALSFPLPPPLADWRITAQLATDDPVRSALWRNRTIYIVVLSLFYVIITIGAVVTLRGISREVTLSRLKTDFVSNISHELRTPLTSIRLFAETLHLGRATTKEEHDACVDFIFHESERLSHLAERTLDWARIEAGRRGYERKAADPGAFVRRVLETFFSLSQLPRERLSVEIAADLPEILVDEGAMAQVLLNLLENAVKYTPLDDKRISVRVRLHRKKVLIDVQDNGIGIAKRDLKRIFDRFYRADDLLARRTEGTGLGLSIARRVVDAHDGRILVESRVGSGSTFTVELPALKPAKKAAAAAATEHAQ